jgi:hypothetical protein
MRPALFLAGPILMGYSTAIPDPWGFCLFGLGAFGLGFWTGYSACESANPGHEPSRRAR